MNQSFASIFYNLQKTHRMQKLLFFAFLSLLCFPTLFAQQLEMKLGKVDKTDLQMTVYEGDSSATAVVLGDYGSITFDVNPGGLRYRFLRHRRVKLLDQSAFDEGDISIPSYRDGERVSKVKAYVILPNGKKIKVSNKDMFEEKISDDWEATKFAFPNLKEGCVIDYSYEITSDNLTTLRDWYFQEDIPIRMSELRVEMPEWFDYLTLFNGQENLADIKTSRDFINTANYQIPTTSTTYLAKDVPALKEESYITTMDDYRMRIQFQLRSVQIPGQTYEKYLYDWDQVAETLREHQYFGDQYTKKRNYKKLLEETESLLAEAGTKAEKVRLAYYYLANTMEWNDEYRLLVNTELDDAFEKKTANSSELNLMLIALLREQGITAHPMLVSTRSSGKMMQHYPIVSQFNHTIAYVELEGKPVLLDVGDANRPMGLPRVESLNRAGWVLADKSATWLNLQAPESADIMVANMDLQKDGTLKGVLNCNHQGYSAVHERNRYNEDKEATYWQERLAEQFVDVKIDSVIFEHADDPEETLKEKIYCTIPAAAAAVGDFIYLSPAVYSSFSENPFKLEKRLYPVDIPYPVKEQIVSIFTIPEGYAVEELPESVNMVLPEDGGQFTYQIAQSDNRVQLVCKMNLNKTFYLPGEYPGVKNFFDIMLQKQGEQIVLKKTADLAGGE